MPEGPEIKREADLIAEVLVGEKPEVYFKFPRLEPFSGVLSGREVVRVSPRGKALLISFAGRLHIFSHNQLYGRWYVVPAGERPKTKRELRLALRTTSHEALLYSASTIDVLDDEERARHPFLSRLGPDLLDPATTLETVIERCGDKAFARKRLSALLLDQGFLCGPGNYLRSEILFSAGLFPADRPDDLNRGELRHLAQTALDLCLRAYRTEGVTNEPRREAALRDLGFSFEDRRFQVFGRDGSPCYQCGHIIVRETWNSRRLYLCPACQASRRLN